MTETMTDAQAQTSEESQMSQEYQAYQEQPAPQPERSPQAPPPGSSGGSWTAVGRQAFDPRRKSPRLAAFLSIAPGVGQLYIGYYVRGFVLAATFLFMLLFAVNAPGYMDPIPGFATFFIWLFNVIDAGRMAALYNHALGGSDRISLPEDFEVPSMGGSIGGGALLVLFGVIALSHTLFGLSLQWLESWWPVFPIGLGVYLLARGYLDRSA
jgi:hypothetical protein